MIPALLAIALAVLGAGALHSDRLADTASLSLAGACSLGILALAVAALTAS